jgi:hypothetical protein
MNFNSLSQYFDLAHYSQILQGYGVPANLSQALIIGLSIIVGLTIAFVILRNIGRLFSGLFGLLAVGAAGGTIWLLYRVFS